MSKKNTKKVEVEIALNTKESVQALLEQYANVSLRKIALATDTTYTLLLKASKKPQVGVAFDPDAINFEEIANYFNRRKILLNDLDWNALNEVAQKDTKIVKDMDQFEVGKDVYLRKYPATPYHIVYKTETHIVIMLDGTTEPQSWSHSTFLLNGPQFTPRAVKASSDNKEQA